MLSNRTTFLGIDPTLSRKRQVFTYALLDPARQLAALGQGSLEDVLAFITGQESVRVAVNAPSRPNQGLMQRPEIRQSLTPAPRPGRWLDLRVAEYALRQRRIAVTPTPERPEDCPNWVCSAFSLYAHLEKLGFQPYPCEDAPLQWLEVNPHASFCALLGQAPFPRHSLEGRLQRQLVLGESGLRIADPMIFFEEITPRRLLSGILPLKEVYTPVQLDALVAAYTAWVSAARPGQITLLGSPEEGQIVIPVHELKERY